MTFNFASAFTFLSTQGLTICQTVLAILGGCATLARYFFSGSDSFFEKLEAPFKWAASFFPGGSTPPPSNPPTQGA
jgi:hypothetical protein